MKVCFWGIKIPNEMIKSDRNKRDVIGMMPVVTSLR